mmetsp:Transcript_27014/g.77938  ORF Transcript_27014/g.77938 Transcript_27014/m.77938 type:complete len:202 (+) Transcript_27014:624-1229(+)
MAWCDLKSTSTELHIDVFIGNDGDGPTSGHGNNGLLTNQVLVSLILRVDTNGCVAHNGLGSSSGYGQELLSVSSIHNVLEEIQLALLFRILNLEIGHGGLEHGCPVHHVLTAVHQALLVKPHKGLNDSFAVFRVHGEALPRPIGTGTKRTELPSDVPTLLGLVLPRTTKELLTANFFARCPLGSKSLFDLKLRGNASMVGS